jgi:hypothetical protein
MTERVVGIKRKEFLKRAGVGAVVVASAPTFADVAWAHDDDDDDRRRFYFQAASGQASALNLGETILMSGCGSFRESSVRGGGEFVHFDGRKIPSPDFIATGTWKARRVLSFQEIGTWGVAVAGILEMRINLIPCEGRAIRGATLEVVCNLGPAGLVTSPFQQEGFTLTVPGLAPFRAFTPNVGLTFFTRRCEEKDD